MNTLINSEHRDIHKHALISSCAGTASSMLLLLLLFLLPVMSGNGGNSEGDGGGGLGSSDAGGGRAAEGEVGQGTSEISEVLEEGGTDEDSDSTDEEKIMAEGTGETPSQEERPRTRREPPKQGLSGFSVAAIPEPQENRSRASAASAGFDDIDDRLAAAGAKTGDVQITLAWNNRNDLDLHVITPAGDRIYFGARRSSDGGELDVDMNAGNQHSSKPVENIFWATNSAPPGKYVVFVHHFANQGGRDPTHFQVVVKANGRTRRFEGNVSSGDQPKKIHDFSR